MKIFSLRPEIPRILEKDIKVLGYGFERDLNETFWDAGDDAHLVDLDLEGEFSEKLLSRVPTAFLNVEPFYSLDKISLRLLRPFHLRAGWKLTFRLKTQYEHRLLIFCIFEPYPSISYRNPTKIRVDYIDKLEDSKLPIEFPTDAKLVSFGLDFSYFTTQPTNMWVWGMPQEIKARISLFGDLGESWVFTDGEYARIVDWFGSITQNGSKRSIEQLAVRRQEFLRIYLEKPIGEYLPQNASNPRFWCLTEYANTEITEQIKKASVSTKGIPKIHPVKIIREFK